MARLSARLGQGWLAGLETSALRARCRRDGELRRFFFFEELWPFLLFNPCLWVHPVPRLSRPCPCEACTPPLGPDDEASSVFRELCGAGGRTCGNLCREHVRRLLCGPCVGSTYCPPSTPRSDPCSQSQGEALSTARCGAQAKPCVQSFRFSALFCEVLLALHTAWLHPVW